MLNFVIANSKTRKKRGYIVITVDISATPYSPLNLLLKQFFNSHLSASPLSLLQRRPQTSSICGWAEEAWNRATKFPINLGRRCHIIRTRQGSPGTRMRMRIKLFILLQSRSQVSSLCDRAEEAWHQTRIFPSRLKWRHIIKRQEDWERGILTFMALHKSMRMEFLILARTYIRTVTWESPQSRAHPTAGSPRHLPYDLGSLWSRSFQTTCGRLRW